MVRDDGVHGFVLGLQAVVAFFFVKTLYGSGIDSWGSDVEEDYHVLADKDIGYGFVIRGTVSEQG